MRKMTVIAVAAAAVALAGGAVVALDGDRGCSGPAYEDFKAHLASRGAEASCDDFKATVAGGMAAPDDTTREGYESLPEQGFEDQPAVQPAVEMVRVPRLIGLDPETAYKEAEAAGLRLSNGRVGSWGVVSTQTPQPGTLVRAGTGVFISISSG